MTLDIEKLKQLAIENLGCTLIVSLDLREVLELIDRLEKAEKFNLMLKAAFSEIGYSVKETENGLEYLKQ